MGVADPARPERVAQPTDAIGQRAAQCPLERINGLEGPARESLLPGPVGGCAIVVGACGRLSTD